MRTKQKIHIVTDEMERELLAGVNEGDADFEPLPEELDAEMDSLIRQVADECCAEIDFDGIKRRAIQSAEKKKSKRRFRRAASYALFACASVLLVFTLAMVVTTEEGNGSTIFDRFASFIKLDGEGNKTAAPSKSAYSRTLIVGTVSGDSKTLIASADATLFPEELPTDMKKTVDEQGLRVYASGTDSSGDDLYYACLISEENESELEVGQAGLVHQSDALVYCWKLSDDRCMKIQFYGFDEGTAEQMFKSLSEKITDAEEHR